MCLMCIPYLDSCKEPECVEAAKLYARENPGSEAYYWGRTPGYERFLYQGYGMDACQHIKDKHGPECEIFTDTDEYSCNCYKEDDGWTYN